jgi:hypothetical protein
MAEKDINMAELSSSLSHCLNVRGYNQDIKKLHESTFKTLDVMGELRSQLTGSQLLFVGSKAEGTAVRNADMDIMSNMTLVEILTKLPDQSTPRTNYKRDYEPIKLLMIEDKRFLTGHVHSGFVLLVQLNDNVMSGAPTTFFSSKQFLQDLAQELPDRGSIHGPCTAFNNDQIVRRGGKDQPTDFALSFKCNSWPDQAIEWLTRERKFKWLPRNRYKRLKRKAAFWYLLAFLAVQMKMMNGVFHFLYRNVT